MNEIMAKWLRRIPAFLFGLVLLWLTLSAAVSTAHLTLDAQEHTFLTADSPWLNLLWALLFFLVLLFRFFLPGWLSGRRLCPNRIPEKEIRRVFLLLIGLTALLFVLGTQKKPGTDQLTIMTIARDWCHGVDRVSTPDEYLYIFHNQRGIVWFIWLLSFVTGEMNYLAFQIVNVLCLVWFYASMMDLADALAPKEEPSCGGLLLLLGTVFLPMILYTGFIYGTIIGLALCAAGMKALVRLLDRFRWRTALFGCILLLAAVLIKQNYMIFLLAFLCALLVSAIEKKNGRLLAPALALALMMVFYQQISGFLVFTATGKFPDGKAGASPQGFVAMGLHENDTLYDGWWNGYIYRTLSENNFDGDVLAAKADEYLQGRLQDLTGDPGYALQFFAGKNLSQWNNPDFQSLWVSAVRSSASPDLKSPPWVEWILSVRGMAAVSAFLDRLQFIILLGALFYLLFRGSGGFIATVVFTVVLGGFLFHTFWEAKAQYVLPYFVMLLPLSARGWTDAAARGAEAVRTARSKGPAQAFRGRRRAWAVPAFVLLLAVVQSGSFPFLNNTVLRNEDTQAWIRYLLQDPDYRRTSLKEGYYYIFSESGQGYLNVLPSGESREVPLSFSDTPDPSAIVCLSVSRQEPDRITLSFSSAGRCLDISGGKIEEGNKTSTYTPNKTAAQRWQLQSTETEGVYRIASLNDNLVLSVLPEENRFVLASVADQDTQRWRFIPVRLFDGR